MQYGSHVEDLSDRMAWKVWGVHPMHNTSVDVMSLAIVLLYVYAAGDKLTPAIYTTYWILLSILHGKVLEAPELLMGYQQGKASIQSFISFISQQTRWQPDAVAAGGTGGGTASSVLALAAAAGDNAAAVAEKRAPDAAAAHELWSFAAVVDEQRNSMVKSGRSNSKTISASDAVANSTTVVPQQPLGSTPACCEVRIPAGDIRWSSTSLQQHASSADDGGVGGGGGGAGITCTRCIIPAGALTCIQGDVGTGKSTLLQGILGELRTSAASGLTFAVPASNNGGNETPAAATATQIIARPACAYVAQQPWLMNKSVRDNIVFDSPFPFDRERYQRACASCALVQDFAALPDGDGTSVGDRGENLSGGQRQRVSMARAAYSKAPVVLLDDALSALDPAVATHTFDACVLGMMAGRTRILVSHSALVVDCADQILSLSAEGVLAPTAMTEAVAQEYSNSATTVEVDTGHAVIDGVIVRPAAASLAGAGLGLAGSAVSSSGGENDGSAGSAAPDSTPLVMLTQRKVPVGLAAPAASTTKDGSNSDGVVGGGNSQCGNGFFTFLNDFNTGIGGGFLIPFLNVLLFGGECGAVEYGVYKVAVYSEEVEAGLNPDDNYYMSVYAVTIGMEILFAYLRGAVQHYGAQKTHRRYQERLLTSIMDAGIEYFDNTPVGEILQIFTGDLDACDGVTVQIASGALVYGVGYGIVVAVVTIVKIPWLAFSVVPSIMAIGCLIYKFQTSSKAVDELSNAHTAVFNLFVELMSGLTTIRATYADPLMYRNFHHSLDKDTAAVRRTKENEHWLIFLTECVAGTFLATIAFAVAGLRANDGVKAQDASFVLLNGCFGNVISFLTVTRQIELANLASHRKRVIAAIPSATTNGDGDGKTAPPMHIVSDGAAPAAAAAAAGARGVAIEIKHVDLTYVEGQAPVIADMHLSIPAGQRIGMVGRTGSGKSTVIRALSGLLAPSNGSITLDGRLIETVPKAELREMVCVIPQVPHLFGGTIRFNLDPVQKHTDAELWKALKDANADSLISKDPQGLNARISSAGADLSSGERQLLCLARALLHRARLILLDEATAALDDTLMESTKAALVACSQSATVIQIAHQTMAVTECDRVIVLHAGAVVEDGPPRKLMQNADGEFATMVSHDARRGSSVDVSDSAGGTPGSTTTATTAVSSNSNSNSNSNTSGKLKAIISEV